MARLAIKPLSVNECWRGRRFKTPKYEAYEREVLYMLKKEVIPQGRLFLRLMVGVSSKNADVDNVIKPFLDILQKKHGFDDKKVYLLEVEKEDVPKGKEFIQYQITALD